MSKRSSLHDAALEGDPEALRELILRKGADVNGLDHNNESALHMAASLGYLKCAEVLLENKTEVDPRGRFQRTPLHDASQVGFLEIFTCGETWS